MRKQNEIRKEGGFVVAIALIGLMTMSFFLITSAVSTTTTLKVSANYDKTVDTFNVAEVGIAKARDLLEGVAFNDLLAQYGENAPLIAKTKFNDGTYEVWVTDNDDGDGDITTDIDNIIIVRSEGVGPTGSRVEIESHNQRLSDSIETPGPGLTAGPPALFCGTNQDLKLRGGQSGIWGTDHDIDGNEIDPNVGDSAIAAQGTINYDGNSNKLYVPSGTDKIAQSLGSAAACDDWSTLANQLASLSANAPGVTVLTEGTYANLTIGDCSANDPRIVIINAQQTTCNGGSGSGSESNSSAGGGNRSGSGGSNSGGCASGSKASGSGSGSGYQDGDVKFTGQTSICGIVVVASDATFSTTGQAEIKGLVLVMGEEAEFKLKGNSDILGKIVSFSPGAPGSNSSSNSQEVNLAASVTGKATLKASKEAIDLATQAFVLANGGGGAVNPEDAPVIGVAWKESY